jgi:hypothetical protein
LSPGQIWDLPRSKASKNDALIKKFSLDSILSESCNASPRDRERKDGRWKREEGRNEMDDGTEDRDSLWNRSFSGTLNISMQSLISNTKDQERVTVYITLTLFRPDSLTGLIGLTGTHRTHATAERFSTPSHFESSSFRLTISNRAFLTLD